MVQSRSTDKLLALSHTMDSMIEKLPPDKISKIKSLSIEWKTLDENGDSVDHPLPELKLSFYE